MSENLQKIYDEYLNKANILMEALPYIQKLSGKTVVIKYGGNAMKDEKITDTILQDVTLLKYVGINPIVVHGGGPDINKMLTKMDIKSEFHNGLRITDASTMEVVQMVLAGKLNKDIAARINSLGGKAIGLCGKDANLIKVVKKAPTPDGVDLGFVGDITDINTDLLKMLVNDAYIPVIASVGSDDQGNSYNINADIVAGEIAARLQVEKLIFLTDIDGIYRDFNDKASLISRITIQEIYDLIDNGTITSGMIPNVKGCMQGIKCGVKRTHILNGTIPHPLILEIFTDKGIGTMVEA